MSVYGHTLRMINASRDLRWFFAASAAAGAGVVFVGFAPTYYLKPVWGGPSLPLRVHIHGILFTAWMLLFVLQSFLIARKRTRMHRRLGIVGAVLIAGMLVSGLSVSIAWARVDSPGTGAVAGVPRLVAVVIPLASIAMFALLASIGLLYRRRPDVHKRLMLLATIALLPPALGRISFLAARGPAAFFAVTCLFIVALAVYDYVIHQRVYPASLWGGLLLAVSFPARLTLGQTHAWNVFAQWLIS